MSIASWLLPVLWRERDWCAALARIAGELRSAAPSAETRRAAGELAQACEHVDPDRRRALAAYELAGETTRARELAIELGWWAAVARYAAQGGDRQAAAEAEAWWDAGQPELATLALAGVRDDGPRSRELAALLAGRDLEDHARTRAGSDPDALVMAARFARNAGRAAAERGHLEAALAARADHAIAARQLLALALAGRDPDQIRTYLRLRLDGQSRTAWLDASRACALALVATEHHRGFGLRLLRHVLERAYQLGEAAIPGHIAMWTALAHHGDADGTRRELLPLAVTAIESTRDAADRVWIAALATEISLREGGNPQVASAYAEIVADHAPDHPSVRELEPSIDIDVDVPLHEPEPEPDLANIIEAANASATQPPPSPPPKIIPPAIKTMPMPKVARAEARPRPGGLPPLSAKLPPLAKPLVDRARRIAIPIDVRVVLPDGTRADGHSRDLSTSGLYVLTTAVAAPGSEVDVTLLLPAKEAFMEDEHRCRARVARRGDDGLGLELIAPDAALQAALAAL